jgi:diguanylate cyclase (GGDEF)-like protein
MSHPSWWDPPDATARELARDGEVHAAYMRLWVAAAGAVTVLFAPSFPTSVYFRGYCAMMVVGLVELLLARRLVPPRWLNPASCLFDITMLNLMNVALVLSGNPLAVTNSRAFFTVTFLFLSLTCLRQDSRLSLLTGIVAIVQYALLLAWITARFDLTSPLLNHAMFGAFTWANQITRFSMLAVATGINVTIINMSRRHWSDSVHDSLTGLVNRRYAEKRFEEALASARRTGRSLVLALVDVDHFKRVNDDHGHAAGDAVLSAVADALRQTFRTSDVLARRGGDEFFILFPDSDPEATLERLKQFHASWSLHPPHQATLSVGVAIWPTDGGNADQLLASADERLYAAKNAGRNRIILPPLPTNPAVRSELSPA